ncbi:hypothetical protein IB275_13555 [Pseudomonas sp. PDM21]|uniref:hypothetical protein n=1 Tax=Pseudomonas sp. PDM21 TaxID=2769257 RepID=UPI00177E888B|nr:hypothetical protein [Pseudomonas sp. PDM21]MBD9671603.1 hypothetical protein [Pseudomonas sp. PDM21]
MTGDSPIFRGIVTVDNVDHRCYIKPATDHIRCPVSGMMLVNRALPAEVIGHVLASICGFKVADPAGIVLLTQEQIPASVLNRLHPQEDYFCWFGRDMEHPSLRQKHLGFEAFSPLMEARLLRLAKELSKHPELARLIAFDEWLLNSDRNLGNLLQTRRGELILIDHERIFVYPNWTPGSMGKHPDPARNRIKDLVDVAILRWSEQLPNKSARVLAYNGFAVSFRDRAANELRENLSKLLDRDEIEAVIDLLEQRLDPGAYARSEGLIV